MQMRRDATGAARDMVECASAILRTRRELTCALLGPEECANENESWLQQATNQMRRDAAGMARMTIQYSTQQARAANEVRSIPPSSIPRHTQTRIRDSFSGPRTKCGEMRQKQHRIPVNVECGANLM